MIVLRLMTLSGRYAMASESKYQSIDDARARVEAWALGGGYSLPVKMVPDDDPGTWRFTAKTPGGRSGRNIAYAHYEEIF